MIIFDVETTGLPLPENAPLAKQPRIIEFAAIKVNSELEIIDKLEFICNPEVEISPKITRITGLTNDDLRKEQSFASHYRELCDFFLGETSLCAHNASFDVKLLKFDLMRIGKLLNFPWPMNHVCTIERTRHVKGKSLKLIALYEIATGKKLKQDHRAMSDVKALFECVKWCVKEELINEEEL